MKEKTLVKKLLGDEIKPEIPDMKWHKRFIDSARLKQSWSKDRSTKHGCVIVDPNLNAEVASGYNGFPRGLDDDIDSRHERPKKYLYTEHSERNAILFCARKGIATEGLHLYVTGMPCPDCARAIAQAGIVKVFVDGASIGGDFDIRWKELTQVSEEMFKEIGIELVIV